jgi:parallel beta-helix repeat protein
MTPMSTQIALLAAGLSDTGRVRRENEDRIHVDAKRGLFVVADGLGGHAAGEHAAEAAVEMIVTRAGRKTGTPEERMREAITVANNEIHSLAAQHPDWKGMACVVTAALVEDGEVTAGHVGDSRLYVLEPGSIRKVTRDHSPVGELEDSGKLSESAAMAHPRRNEVFRDLGSEPHSPDDAEFIDLLRFPFRPNMALLVCSDGLSDLLTSDQIRRTVEGYPREPKRAVRALVQAANDAGGKDNISVVLVEGPSYSGPLPNGAPHVAAAPVPPPRRRGLPVLAFLLGLLVTAGAFALLRPYLVETTSGLKVAYGTVRPPFTWNVASGARIEQVLAHARPGDTVIVAPGTYHGSLTVPNGVALLSTHRHAAVIESSGIAISADGVRHARLAGFKIAGTGAIGIRIKDSEIEVTDVEITGMREAAIEVEGESPALIRANTIVGNPGVGIFVRGAARPVITNNVVIGNGRTPGALRPGIHVAGAAAPIIQGNVVAENGVEQIWASPFFNTETLLQKNFIAPGSRDRKNLIKVVTR